MSPEVIAGKLSLMTRYLKDLSAYETAGFDAFMVDHYKIERLLELLVMAATDISFHLLALQQEPPPTSCRAAFLRLGELGILGRELSSNLALGAGLKNIIVHEYEELDCRLLHSCIPRVIKDITAFMLTASRYA